MLKANGLHTGQVGGHTFAHISSVQEIYMAKDRSDTYHAALASLEAADNEATSLSGGAAELTQYNLAVAQVQALLAVADELHALRRAVNDVSASVGNLDGEHSNLRGISDWLKDIAEKR